eukprot:scaffold66229_cov27-Attheya_sp.AAC.1
MKDYTGEEDTKGVSLSRSFGIFESFPGAFRGRLWWGDWIRLILEIEKLEEIVCKFGRVLLCIDCCKDTTKGKANSNRSKWDKTSGNTA